MELVMVLIFDDLEFHLVETTGRRRGYRGGPGWYWQESHLPPVGSFRSAPEALRDLTEWIESGKLAAALEAQAERRRVRLAEFDEARRAKGLPALGEGRESDAIADIPQTAPGGNNSSTC